jgi:hypothetical protein
VEGSTLLVAGHARSLDKGLHAEGVAGSRLKGLAQRVHRESLGRRFTCSRRRRRRRHGCGRFTADDPTATTQVGLGWLLWAPASLQDALLAHRGDVCGPDSCYDATR